MHVPISDFISNALNQTIEAWIAEAELPSKVVKFHAAASQLA
jgi:hypothetical protein